MPPLPSSTAQVVDEPPPHPALDPSVTSVPVTPGVHSSGHSAYMPPEPVPDVISNGVKQNGDGHARSYFAEQSEDQQGLLRLNLKNSVAAKTEKTDTDPKVAHPELNLSGRVVSAAFCIPYDVEFSAEHEWELKPRRGTSAVFDSFSYLSSAASPWNHTLVGWTGEITLPAEVRQPSSASLTSLNLQYETNKASAPIPVDGTNDAFYSDRCDSLSINRAERQHLEKQLERQTHVKIAPVWLMDESDEDKDSVVFKDQSRWRRYAEHELYTTFHYKQNDATDGRAARRSYDDYYRMNKSFADRILEIYQPGDMIMIHDFYLLMLPSLLRQRLPNAYIGFYLHIPFPSSEIYRCLVQRQVLLEGVLRANMIAFQSYSYASHFTSCCERLFGFVSTEAGIDAFGSRVVIDVFPFGIDVASTQQQAFGGQSIEEKIKGIRDLYAGKKLIVGRDRLDSVRGIAQKLQGFELFLQRYAEWRGKVVLIQVTSPSGPLKSGKDDDEKVVNKIAELVARINGTYGSLSFTPVQYFPQYLTQEEYFALLRVADVGLITSVRDGMNTTSLEFIICQKDNCGPLILSEFSGTAGSLSTAMHINPWNLGAVADAIDQALTMPAEKRKEQHGKLYQYVVSNDIQTWTQSFLQKMMHNLSRLNQSSFTPLLDRTKLLHRYQQSKRRLFMFDYDGTLTPIVSTPGAAIPSDRVIRTLKELASDPRNSVWIVSGREQTFLDEWMGHIGELGLSAEHGSFMRYPGQNRWVNLTETMDMGWRAEALDIFQKYTDKTPGSQIECKKIAITWHYRQASKEYAAFQALECQKLLNDTVAIDWDVDVMPGKANLEVRPRYVNKGYIAKRLVYRSEDVADEAPDFVLCVGDDHTDEDMFRALRQTKLPQEVIFSVTVGPTTKQTLASWCLLDPSDVISVISLLGGTVDAGDVGAVAAVDDSVPESSRNQAFVDMGMP